MSRARLTACRAALASAGLAVLAAGGLDARADRLCFEAEHAVDLYPNLEIVSRPGASGGLALGVDEGGGGNHTWLGGMGSSIDIGTAAYPFVITQAGPYVVWARAWWSDKCGNSMLVSVDGSRGYSLGDGEGEDPVFEVWHWVPSCRYDLGRGRHTLNAMAKEDGVYIDQWCVLPPGQTPTGQETANAVPALGPETPTAIDLSLSRASDVVDANGEVRFTAWLRKCRAGKAAGTLAVACPEEGPALDRKIPFEIPDRAVLWPLPVVVKLPDASPRSEKRIDCRVASGGVVLASRAFIAIKPWRWHFLGRLDADVRIETRFENGERVETAAPVDLVDATGAHQVLHWQTPDPSTYLNRYQTIDLERVFGESTGCCAYLAAAVASPRVQDALLLVNNDDAADVWLNGGLVFHDAGGHPAEGFLGRATVHLREGTNRILARVTQSADPKRTDSMHAPNYWLFRLRLRKSNHAPADISGE